MWSYCRKQKTDALDADHEALTKLHKKVRAFYEGYAMASGKKPETIMIDVLTNFMCDAVREQLKKQAELFRTLH